MWHKKQGSQNTTLGYSRVNGAWLRGLPFNDNLLLSVHQERLNPLVNITSDTIFTNFEYKFLVGYSIKCFAEVNILYLFAV